MTQFKPQRSDLTPQYEGDEPSPEDFLPSPKREATPFERMPGSVSLWPGALLFAVMTFASLLSWSKPDQFGVFNVTRASIIDDHQYWRLVSAILGHGDVQHLFHNLPVFLFFAWLLQGYFGILASVVLPLVIGILSNAITVFFYDDHVRLLGASGMIFGMVALWLVFYIHFDLGNWWVKRVMRAVGFSLLVLFPQTYDPRVSYLAHFSGFMCGVFFGFLFLPIIKRVAPVTLTIDMHKGEI